MLGNATPDEHLKDNGTAAMHMVLNIRRTRKRVPRQCPGRQAAKVQARDRLKLVSHIGNNGQ